MNVALAVVITLFLSAAGVGAYGVQLAYTNAGEIQGIEANLDHIRKDLDSIVPKIDRVYENSIVLCNELEVNCK